MRHSKWWVAVVLFVALAACLAGPATAQGLEESLFITGFVSQGYMNTSKNTYLVPRSVHGTAEFTEAAITLVAQPRDRLRVGIQLLARNFGDVGDDYVALDWAYGDYRFHDWFGLRLGKVKMPFGFYNEGRDVDMLRTSIFLPQSIYNETMRDFLLAYEGIGAYGGFTLGGMGDGDYHVYGGTLNVPSADKGFWNDVFDELGQAGAPLVGRLVSEATGIDANAQYDGSRDQVVSFPWIYGGALNWNTPIRGVRLGASAMQGRFNVQGRLRYDVFLDAGSPGAVNNYVPFTLNVDDTPEISHIAVFSGEFQGDRWSVAGEYYNDKISGDSSYGWYAQLGMQATDRLALSTYYSDSRPGSTGVASMGEVPDYYSWQKDLTFSLRYDLTNHWLVKLETHFINGVAATLRTSAIDSNIAALEKNWGMLVAKTTFHF